MIVCICRSVSGTWSRVSVSGAWSSVSGAWSSVSGTWSCVSGTWSCVWYMVVCIRYMVVYIWNMVVTACFFSLVRVHWHVLELLRCVFSALCYIITCVGCCGVWAMLLRVGGQKLEVAVVLLLVILCSWLRDCVNVATVCVMVKKARRP